jgi:hypothetical protein
MNGGPELSSVVRIGDLEASLHLLRVADAVWSLRRRTAGELAAAAADEAAGALMADARGRSTHAPDERALGR